MDIRRCANCNKPLPKKLRAQARYCTGKRGVACRQEALRKRRRGHEQDLPNALMQTLPGSGQLPIDPWCQATAELAACERLIEYYKDRKYKLKDEQYRLDRAMRAEIRIIKKDEPIPFDKRMKKIGLVILQSDCEIRAILVVSER